LLVYAYFKEMKITDYTENNEKSINQLYALYAGFSGRVFLFFINEFARQLDSHTAMFLHSYVYPRESPTLAT